MCLPNCSWQSVGISLSSNLLSHYRGKHLVHRGCTDKRIGQAARCLWLPAWSDTLSPLRGDSGGVLPACCHCSCCCCYCWQHGPENLQTFGSTNQQPLHPASEIKWVAATRAKWIGRDEIKQNGLREAHMGNKGHRLTPVLTRGHVYCLHPKQIILR